MKKILITEEQLEFIVNFIKNSKLDEQLQTPKGVRVDVGRAGLTKKEFEKQEKEKESGITEGSPEEMIELFIKKFSSDLGKQTLFKRLPTDLKEKMLSSWFNEGGLPEDFFENPDDYKFKVKKLSGGIADSYSGEDGKEKVDNIELIYKNINLENFQNYNGTSNNYKYIQVKKGTGKPIFDENNQPKIGTLTLEGHQLFVLTPGIGEGDEAKLSQTTITSGEEKKFIVEVPPIPINFVVEKSNITTEGETALKDKLIEIFQNNEKIKYAKEKGLNYTVTDIKIICSASNTWGKKTLPFTHNNDGTKSNIKYDDTVPNATKNLQLAKDRGATLSNILKNNQEIKNNLKIDEKTTFKIEGIVTNTNGMTDEQIESTGTKINKGQFAKFTFKVSYKEKFPGKEDRLIKINNLAITLVKEKSEREFKNLFSMNMMQAKYLDRGGKRKSAREISKNVGKSFRGFGGLINSLLP